MPSLFLTEFQPAIRSLASDSMVKFHPALGERDLRLTISDTKASGAFNKK
jgi:hypothetical protein